MDVRVCGARLNFSFLFVYRSSSIDDSVCDCLLEFISKIQSEYRKSVSCFFGYFNGQHIANGLDLLALMYKVQPILLRYLDAPN